MKLLARLEKSPSFWFLFFSSLIFIVLRIPSLFEPYWYGDEGVYQAVGMLINSGEKLYIGAWDNKPPLLLALYALFNSDQFSLRLISLIFGVVSIWFFYFISKKLLSSNRYAPFISTLIYTVLFGTIIIEGNIANAENFMLLPILIGAFLILYEDPIKRLAAFKTFMLAGFSISFSFLFKIVAVFDFLAFSFFLFINPENNFKDNIRKKVLPLSLGFLLPVLAAIAYFLLTNNLKDFMDALLFKNIGYVGKENEFFIPQGLLILKSIILVTFLLFLFWKRRVINKNLLFILIWFGFSLFSAFFSQRPYTHYLIMFLPSFALMIGAIINFKKERILLLILLVLSYLVIRMSFELNTNLTSYYLNFVNFSLNKKSVYDYQSFFDRRTPIDYDIANYIKTNTNEEDLVFIWGNNAMIYKLAEKTPILRYTVAYHMTAFPLGIKNMTDAINTKKPKFIIIMPNMPNFPLPLTGYSEKIDVRGAKVYEKIL